MVPKQLQEFGYLCRDVMRGVQLVPEILENVPGEFGQLKIRALGGAVVDVVDGTTQKFQ